MTTTLTIPPERQIAYSDLTERQWLIVGAVKGYWSLWHHAPSVEELATYIGTTSDILADLEILEAMSVVLPTEVAGIR